MVWPYRLQGFGHHTNFFICLAKILEVGANNPVASEKAKPDIVYEVNIIIT